MPADRIAHAVAAVASLSLAIAAFFAFRAESAYRAGQLLDPRPERDLPGRLEAYLQARTLRPSDGVYAWRVGQLLLGRAADQRGAEQLETLRLAAEHTRDAVSALPLDARVRVTSAQSLWALSLREQAMEEMRAARRLAPLHTRVAAMATRMFADGWLAGAGGPDGGAELLRDACEAARMCREAEQPVPTRWLAQHLAQAGHELFGRVLGDAADDPDLLDEVARVLDRVRPADAALLRDAAAEIRRRRGGR